ncbi:unnamed protein product [Heligmosomoides polygyrus]|uniref:Leucine zipper with capping helix domain-containing protein n=1 Tax=Heligmosomoides polygyrus TaxID=6339 RepID=A0A3P8GKC7_HELPZ|nr:unnamed protein product [Heligmosomoides polygyrus]
MQSRKRKISQLEESVKDLEKRIKDGAAQLKEQKKGKEAERTELLELYTRLQEEEKELSDRLSQYAEYDPEAIAQVKLRTEKAREDANRWTDNVFAIKKWCKSKFGIEEKVLDKQFEIPEDFDYVE